MDFSCTQCHKEFYLRKQSKRKQARQVARDYLASALPEHISAVEPTK